MDLATLLVTLVAVAMLLQPLVLALTEAIKGAWKGATGRKLPSEFVPTVAVVIGVVLALLLGSRAELAALDWQLRVVVGAIAGLMASRLFDAGQSRAPPTSPVPHG